MRLKIVNHVEEVAHPRLKEARWTVGRASVVNAETGEEIHGISRVSVTIDRDNNFVPVATIDVRVDIDLDVIGIIEAKKVFA